MVTAGSIMLIFGATSLVAYMVLAAMKPRLFPRLFSVVLIVALLLLTCTGLIVLTIAKGGSSLHTGG